MKITKAYFLLIIIVLVGAVFRLFQLGSIPNSLNWDEVSWGYNAYSIAKTGMDEYGVSYPLSFEAFGDYKQPVYVYITAPFVALLGLASNTVRLPSALSGIFMIILVFLLVKDLFVKHKHKDYIALIAAFVFAVSPWSVHFSRLAYEANVAIMLVMLGAWAFVRGINTKSWIWLFVSVVPLALSSYTYHAEKIFTPLLFVGLIVFGFSFLKKRYLFFGLLIAFFIFANSFWLLDMRTTARGRSVTIFSNQTPILEQSVKRIEQDAIQNNILGNVVHNRRVVFTKVYVDNYLKHFDPNYLFVTGFDVRHHAPGVGLLYLISIPFILIGIVYLIKNFNRSSGLVLYWLLLAPLASALAANSPNASRALTFLPTWYIFEAFGLYLTYQFFRTKKYHLLAFIVLLLMYIGNIYYYTHQYFSHVNTDDEWAWQYGYEQAVDYVEQNNFQSVVFDDSIEQGYMFYLFHSQYDPLTYIQSGGTNDKGQCFQIENIYFGTSCIDVIQPEIIITTRQDNIQEYDLIDTIFYSNGEKAIYIQKARGEQI